MADHRNYAQRFYRVVPGPAQPIITPIDCDYVVWHNTGTVPFYICTDKLDMECSRHELKPDVQAGVNSPWGGRATRFAVGDHLRGSKVFVPAPATVTGQSPVMSWDFGAEENQGVVLRGTGQGAALNLAGVTVTGANWIIWVVWTEE